VNKQLKQYDGLFWTIIAIDLINTVKDKLSDELRKELTERIWKSLSFQLYHNLEAKLVGNVKELYE